MKQPSSSFVHVCAAVICVASITYKLLNSFIHQPSAHNTPSSQSPFSNDNILHAANLSISRELTTQITSNIISTLTAEPDLADIDIWALIFSSICCQSSLFRRKIWEKQLAYIPLSTALQHTPYLQLLSSSLPHLHHINATYKLLEYEYLYESSNNFFISTVIKSTAHSTAQRIGPRRMKSALRHSTLVINEAGIIFPGVHKLEVSLMNTFGYPANSNVYFSASASKHRSSKTSNVSSRIHTDRQDVFIVQVAGCKRWKLWTPRAKLAFFREQRGKDEDDRFSPPSDLGVQWNDTLLDVVLRAGDLLYIPRAFPHQVELVEAGESGECAQISTHLTVGVETETLGLTMDNLLMCMLGINEKLSDSKGQRMVNELVAIILDIVKHDKYEHFRRSVPFGFNVNKEDEEQQYVQVMNRVHNLSNSVVEMKRRLGSSVEGREESKAERVRVSMDLVKRAYAIFKKANRELMQIYKRKRELVQGENWNQDQEQLQKMLIKKVKRYFKKCSGILRSAALTWRIQRFCLV